MAKKRISVYPNIVQLRFQLKSFCFPCRYTALCGEKYVDLIIIQEYDMLSMEIHISARYYNSLSYSQSVYMFFINIIR